MKQKNFTLSHHPIKTAAHSGWAGYLSKLVALVLLVGGLGATQQALGQTFYDDAITLTQQPTGASSSSVNYAGKRSDAPYNTYTRLGNANASPVVTSPNIGTYDLNTTSALTLSAGSIVVSPPGRNLTYNAARILYRVYLINTTPVPSYSQITLTQTGTDSFGDYIYSTGNSNTNIDLLNGLTSGGNYNLEVQFVIDVSDGTNITPTIDPSGTSGYTAAFYITPPPTTPAGGTTTWQGTARGANGTVLTSDTEWTNTANWSNGVPNATSNAIIPPKSSASTVYPILNDATYNYAVNNLTLQGNSGSTAAQLVLNVATLSVYGNLAQPGGGLAGNITNAPGVADKTQNSTIIFAGKDQVITGQLLVSDIIIAGSGVKSVINTMIPANIIAFRPTSVTDGVIVQSAAQDVSSGSVSTVFDTTGNSFINLTANSSVSAVAGDAETPVSYIKGVTRIDRRLVAGVHNTYGNIGIELDANHTPGALFVYRVVGDPLSGPVSSTAVPIKRYFKIIGDDDSRSSSTSSSTIDVIFHYLNSADELNGIQESNLAMFRSEVNGAPYTALGGTLNTTNKTVTRSSIPSLSTSYITLGDKTNPLPVSLVAFNAVRSGANTLLSWTTASEQNNKGFNVQVSADGVNYRTLAFIASKSPNSSNELTYKYTDVEAGKVGTRYYRLEQVDEDGKLNYSPVRAVGFDGAAATSLALVAYPNPFSDTIGLTVEGATTTEGAAYVKLVDMTGRTVLDQKVSLNGASLTLSDVSGLRSGLYLAKVTLPDGTVQTVRVQKQ